MKLFQVVDNICHYDMTHLYSSLEEAKSKYPPELQIVEAPDFVFEGWGYDPETKGFIQPTTPEGWVYDETTGTYYNPTAETQAKIASLQSQLDQTDYKIIKCYEYSLVDKELPYDVAVLHSERQALRDEINTLQEELENGNS